MLVGEDLISLSCQRARRKSSQRLLREMTWAKSVESQDQGTLVLSLEDKSIGIPEIVRMAKTHGFSISSIKSSTPNLNDVLLHYVKKSVEEHDE